MMIRHCSWILAGLVPLLLCGCLQPSDKTPRQSGAATSSPAADVPEEPVSDGGEPAADPAEAGDAVAQLDQKPDAKVFKFGDLIAPFSPPTLEDLEGQVVWEDRPVVDSLKLLREKKAQEKPLISVAEALKLRNQSPADNKKILSALGKLAESESEVNWDATITRHAAGDVNSVNPILISSTIEFDVSGLISFGLFGFDWDFNPFASADTVESWQTSKDGLYDKVVMRKDLTWSDGTPITAHDVVFSYKTILTSAVPVPAVRSGTEDLKWVEAYDDHTLIYFQKEPYATNVWNLNFPVIPRHIYEPTLEKDPTLVRIREHVRLENNPVTGGAYTIKSRLRGNEIVLERREDWYMHEGKQVRDKPYFKTIRFLIRPDVSVALLAMKAGDLDEMQLNPEHWQTQTSDDSFYRHNTKAYETEWTEFHFLWNQKSPFFSDKRVRKAMSYAMDYEELIKTLRYGLDERCYGIFHPTSKWAAKPAPKPYEQDFDKAEELLEAAGWTDSDGDGIRDKVIGGRRVKFEFTILTSNRQDRIDICTLLKECLDQIQVKCNVQPLEFPALIDKLQKRDFQASFGGWGTGTDPYTLENIFKTGKDRNYGGYSNPEVDKLFDAGMRELDLKKRAAIYQKIHLQLYEDQPYTWLYHQNAYYGFNKSLRGYNFSPRGPYNYGPGFGSIWKPAAQ